MFRKPEKKRKMGPSPAVARLLALGITLALLAPAVAHFDFNPPYPPQNPRTTTGNLDCGDAESRPCWASKPELPMACSDQSAVTIESRVYFVAGCVPPLSPPSDLRSQSLD